MSSIRLRRWTIGTVAAVLVVAAGVIPGAVPATAGTSTARYHCVPPAASGKPAFDTDIPITLAGPASAQVGQPITLTTTIPDSGQTNPGPIALAGMKQWVEFSVTADPATVTTIGSQTGSIPIGAPLPNPAMTAAYTPTAAGTYTFVPTKYTLGVDTGIIGWLDTPCTPLTPPAPAALTIEVAAGGGNTPFAFGLTGSTTIKAATGTVPLAGRITGEITGLADITADLVLDPATGTFKAFGFLPVTARVAFSQEGATTGSIRDGVLTTSTNMRVKVLSVKLFGIIPIGGGPDCQTTSAATIELTSQAGFNPITGGELAGVYTLPGLTGCGLLTPVISALFAGPGNNITVTLTPAS